MEEHEMSAASGDCVYNPDYGMPILDYRGVRWMPPSTRAFVDKVAAFPLDPSDVIVAAYPKSGTNWLQIMIANFYDDWGTCTITPHRRVPSLDVEIPNFDFEGYSSCIAAKIPRLMKTHLPASAMPDRWFKTRSKIVYITRNPKDVCCSYYHQVYNANLGLEAGFDLWVDRFCFNRVPWTGWLENVLSWHRYGETDGVLHTTYEKMRVDPVGEMRRVIKFLGKPVTEERFQQVVRDARFENMHSSGLSSQINAGLTNDKFMRQGSVGGWRNTLSAAQSAKIDDVIVRPLEAAGVVLSYEQL